MSNLCSSHIFPFLFLILYMHEHTCFDVNTYLYLFHLEVVCNAMALLSFHAGGKGEKQRGGGEKSSGQPGTGCAGFILIISTDNTCTFTPMPVHRCGSDKVM
uniref:Secreted protein n=1 Tax=Palpitomonas bilix TaxID=652834 RepID=A0A7S3G0T2_9EUKA|mmetsp:Transcript_1258/g.2587  ORF Transcript_1258/g.2587 Transcript_1258/m.2587 type:complete len:102 (+) Transcript_1258:92-397(+)